MTQHVKSEKKKMLKYKTRFFEKGLITIVSTDNIAKFSRLPNLTQMDNR